MPDHLHLLVNPSEQTSLISFEQAFGSSAATVLWQKG